jgi:hypothetical protein
MTSGLVLSFVRRAFDSSDWNQQELAEFYRVENMLLQGGLSVTTDRGISDQGDPWFIFCRADNEEVIAHFARIDGEYLIVSNFHSGVARGTDFRRLIRQMIESHPLMLPIKRAQNQKIFLHPAALLTALLASAYFLSNEKDATSGNGSHDNTKKDSISSLLGEKFGILAAASLAAIWIEHQADSLFKFLENTVLVHENMPSQEKGNHVAEIAQDASLDTAIMQTVRDLESGAHRGVDLSSSNLAATQEGNEHDHAAPALITQSSYSLGSAADGGIASLWAATPVNNDRVADSHLAMPTENDSVVVSGNPQPVVQARDIAPAMPVPNQLAPSPQSSAPSAAIVATSEAAVQLAISDIPNSSIQPVVLASGTVPLSLALDQVSAQVGLGSTLPQNSTASDSTPSNSIALAANSAQSGASISPSISQIMQTVEAFLVHTPSHEFAVSGSNFFIVDTKLSDASSPNFGVLTWDLSNGSTLSIVGIIPHHHAAATA